MSCSVTNILSWIWCHCTSWKCWYHLLYYMASHSRRPCFSYCKYVVL